VEDDVRIYVRAAKDHFRRLRPYEIEPRLRPCIENVKGDLSYPSGHAAFAWAMYFLLKEMVPERRQELEARTREYAHQRMVCGVHFASDLEAGRLAAGRVIDAMVQVPRFREEFRAAAQEMRAALRLPPISPEPN
jgi:acid phosphatase (class A)